MRRLAVAFAMLAFAACGRAHRSSPSGSAQRAAVAAVVGDRQITLANVDAKLGDDLFQMRRSALDELVAETVLAVEAKRRKTSEDELVAHELAARGPAEDEATLRRMFDDAMAAGKIPPHLTFETARPRLAAAAHDRNLRNARRRLVERLQVEQHADIRLIALDPPRVDVQAVGPARGPADAKVTIVEFADFECPFCKMAEDSVSAVLGRYGDRVRFVFRHNPIAEHAHAEKLAEASVCAQDQGRFWEYHDSLFAGIGRPEGADPERHAQVAGLHLDQFRACLDSGKHKKLVERDIMAANAAHVNGTPSFVVNGRMLSGAVSVAELSSVIEEELAATKTN
jgi:protein-disulfide isomerase